MHRFGAPWSDVLQITKSQIKKSAVVVVQFHPLSSNIKWMGGGFRLRNKPNICASHRGTTTVQVLMALFYSYELERRSARSMCSAWAPPLDFLAG
jgi:hypothetical protein